MRISSNPIYRAIEATTIDRERESKRKKEKNENKRELNKG